MAVDKATEETFTTFKRLLTSCQVLVHFYCRQENVPLCDASVYGIVAVLAQQMADGSEKLIGFASPTLSNAENKYSQAKKKGLACVFGVKRFHACMYLYGHPFTPVIDHKTLLALFSPQRGIPPQVSAYIQVWALTSAMYKYTLAFTM